MNRLPFRFTAIVLVPIFACLLSATPSLAQTCGFSAVSTCASAAIWGTVYWPDMSPASNVQVDLMPDGPTDNLSWVAPDAPQVQFRTDANGQYAASACPCDALMGFLIMDDGQFPCQMIMGAEAPGGPTPTTSAGVLKMLQGVQAQPGDNVNWIIAPIRCTEGELSTQRESITPQWLALMNSTGGGWGNVPRRTWQEMRTYLAQNPNY